ncbi:MAG: hypothetical protein ACLSAP_01085 [Oscillospiraceae bacterium]
MSAPARLWTPIDVDHSSAAGGVRFEPEGPTASWGLPDEEEMRRILESLSFRLEGETIIVPSFRSDIEHKADIGGNRPDLRHNIPTTLLKAMRRAIHRKAKFVRAGEHGPACTGGQRDHDLFVHQPQIL